MKPIRHIVREIYRKRNAKIIKLAQLNTIRQISERLQISRAAIHAVLSSHGVKAKGSRDDAKEWRKIAEKLAPTHSYPQLVKITGKKADTIKQYLSSRGIRIGVRANPRKLHPKRILAIEILAAIRARSKSSLTDIALSLGVTKEYVGQVHFWAKKHGML